MATITIPKKLIQNDDLVVIPRKEYEKMQARMIPTFYLEGKGAKKLDDRVKLGVEEHQTGKTQTLNSFLEKEYPHLSQEQEYGN